MIYVLLRVDEAVLPRNGVLDRGILRRRKETLLDVVDVYLNQYMPLRLFGCGERLFGAWREMTDCMGEAGESGLVDHVAMNERWEMENEEIYDNIIENMLWTRDVPRNYRYDSSYSHFDRFKERIRSKLEKY